MRAVLVHKYCSNCLAHEHSNGSCRSKSGCRQCRQSHHTLLHEADIPRAKEAMTARSSTSATSLTVASILAQHVIPLFPTALVKIQIRGRMHYARALLDPCIGRSRISLGLVDALHIPTSKIGKEEFCSIIIRAHSDPQVKMEATLVVTNRVNLQTPSKSLEPKIKNKFSNLILADPDFDRSAKVSLVLGSDVYPKTLVEGLMPSSGGYPVAQNTIFGWVLSGTCSN